MLARGRDRDPANPKLSLTRPADQKSNGNRNLVGREPREQTSQTRNLVQPSRGRRDLGGEGDQLIQLHYLKGY